jgi:hypothetical protein
LFREAIMNSTLDAATGALDWTPLATGLAEQAAFVTLGVGLLLLGILLLTALFGSGEKQASFAATPAFACQGSAQAGATVSVRAADRATEWDGEARPVAVAVGGDAAQIGPTTSLQSVGLTPTDLVALTALRNRIQHGEVAEGATNIQRLSFARWLVQHGRLGG